MLYAKARKHTFSCAQSWTRWLEQYYALPLMLMKRLNQTEPGILKDIRIILNICIFHLERALGSAGSL
jgi:hypothetical protein